jgi:hypothetical protein
VPASSVDPGASPSIATLTLEPPFQYEMANGAGSLARNSRTPPTVNRGIDFGARAISGEVTGSVAGTVCSASATGDGC